MMSHIHRPLPRCLTTYTELTSQIELLLTRIDITDDQESELSTALETVRSVQADMSKELSDLRDVRHKAYLEILKAGLV